MVYLADLSIFKLFEKALYLRFIRLKNGKLWWDEDKEPVAVYRWWGNPFSMISVHSKKQKQPILLL